MHTHPTQRHVLRLDPELGRYLSPGRLALADEQLTAHVVRLFPGRCAPEQFLAKNGAAVTGTLILSGAIMREIRMQDVPSAELLGPGDILRGEHADFEPQVAPISVHWDVLKETEVALLSARVVAGFPELSAATLDRFNARVARLAVAQAISQLTGVENRVEMLLWHLSERWGRVGAQGVTVRLPLSHRSLGALVGARRPTVSTAMSRLAEEDRVTRGEDGGWLLRGFGPPSSFGSREADGRQLSSALAA